MYQEFANGYSVLSATSLTCRTQSSCAAPSGLDPAHRRAHASYVRQSATQSMCCSIADDHLRLHRGAARPGDGEHVGKAGHHQPEIGHRPALPISPPAPGRLPTRMSISRSAPVIASKPVAKTIASSSYSPSSVRTPAGGDLLDRVRLYIHQRHVVAVVGLVIIGIETQPLGADRMVFRRQQSRRSRDRGRWRGSCRRTNSDAVSFDPCSPAGRCRNTGS